MAIAIKGIPNMLQGLLTHFLIQVTLKSHEIKVQQFYLRFYSRWAQYQSSCYNIYNKLNRSFLERPPNQTVTQFFITHLRNSIDLVMNDLCYEYSQDGVSLNSVSWVFIHKEVRCSSKIEIKVGLQYANEKTITVR